MVVNVPPLICISLTEAGAAKLANDGPRRDIELLATTAGGTLLWRSPETSRIRPWWRFAGPHLRQAWQAVAAAAPGATVFADGEHLGFPVAGLLALRGRRTKNRLVVLGHYVDKPWKKALLWAASRMVRQGVLILHSATQAEHVRRLLPAGWEHRLVPYQVDAEYWTARRVGAPRPLLVAVGSENRDYQTLVEAVRGLDIDVKIAAGSHWAREKAEAHDLPGNVEFFTETLSFARLRELYSEAWVVVAPLYPVSNQSGVTTILEAMSMARPVIVTATPGQREVVVGPLVEATGKPEDAVGRGPALFGLAPGPEDTGAYVPPGNAAALRRAIQMMVSDRELAERMGTAGRALVTRHFTVEAFAERFSAILHEEAPRTIPVAAVSPSQ